MNHLLLISFAVFASITATSHTHTTIEGHWECTATPPIPNVRLLGVLPDGRKIVGEDIVVQVEKPTPATEHYSLTFATDGSGEYSWDKSGLTDAIAFQWSVTTTGGTINKIVLCFAKQTQQQRPSPPFFLEFDVDTDDGNLILRAEKALGGFQPGRYVRKQTPDETGQMPWRSLYVIFAK